MAKRGKKAGKSPTESLRRMEQAAQDHMVRALVQAYKQQMQRMNAEIATFLRDAPGAFEAPPTQPKDS